jgi:DNA-binding transcriptional ArsR family regulator
MSDPSAQMLTVLEEMRDLLRLLAEPAIAARDKKLREELRGIAGSATGKKAKAVLLMDGTRTQANIVENCGISKGNLSGLVKELRAAELLKGDPKQPQLVIPIPSNFFEQAEGS